MHKVILVFICAALAFSSKGQQVEDIGKISLSAAMPDNIPELNEQQKSFLATKIQHIALADNVATGINGSFVIYPKISINDVKVVEGGMENITIVKVLISMFIKQMESDISFASVTKEISGTGKTKEMAISNAISKISVNDIDFKNFISSGKVKVIEYYEKNCSNIILKSKDMAKKGNYEAALELLMSVPIEAQTCYSTAQEASLPIYKNYSNKICNKQILQAKSYQAANEYISSLEVLSSIDPESLCNKEALQLINVAKGKISSDEKKRWDLLLKAYDNEVALEKHRINAIKEIAVAYIKSNNHKKSR